MQANLAGRSDGDRLASSLLPSSETVSRVEHPQEVVRSHKRPAVFLEDSSDNESDSSSEEEEDHGNSIISTSKPKRVAKKRRPVVEPQDEEEETQRKKKRLGKYSDRLDKEMKKEFPDSEEIRWRLWEEFRDENEERCNFIISVNGF